MSATSDVIDEIVQLRLENAALRKRLNDLAQAERDANDALVSWIDRRPALNDEIRALIPLARIEAVAIGGGAGENLAGLIDVFAAADTAAGMLYGESGAFTDFGHAVHWAIQNVPGSCDHLCMLLDLLVEACDGYELSLCGDSTSIRWDLLPTGRRRRQLAEHLRDAHGLDPDLRASYKRIWEMHCADHGGSAPKDHP